MNEQRPAHRHSRLWKQRWVLFIAVAGAFGIINGLAKDIRDLVLTPIGWVRALHAEERLLKEVRRHVAFGEFNEAKDALSEALSHRQVRVSAKNTQLAKLFVDGFAGPQSWDSVDVRGRALLREETDRFASDTLARNLKSLLMYRMGEKRSAEVLYLQLQGSPFPYVRFLAAREIQSEFPQRSIDLLEGILRKNMGGHCAFEILVRSWLAKMERQDQQHRPLQDASQILSKAYELWKTCAKARSSTVEVRLRGEILQLERTLEERAASAGEGIRHRTRADIERGTLAEMASIRAALGSLDDLAVALNAEVFVGIDFGRRNQWKASAASFEKCIAKCRDNLDLLNSYPYVCYLSYVSWARALQKQGLNDPLLDQRVSYAFEGFTALSGSGGSWCEELKDAYSELAVSYRQTYGKAAIRDVTGFLPGSCSSDTRRPSMDPR